ncbi:alpha/beta hydrolase [Rhodovulum sp. DZ06]|uniref:alpha/beta hydrolase n=1 Tax=Rhodovulum sp. DZ06 TaxID=3425126 RepID=UPI003D352DF6
MIHPEIEPFLAAWDAAWARLPEGQEGPAGRRAFFEVIAKEMRMETPAGVSTEEERHVDSPAGPVRVRIFRPEGLAKDDAAPLPVHVYLHGGGWMQGSPETHWDITARLAAWGGRVVVSVDYALAPEDPFPAAFEQVCAVLRAIHADPAGWDVDGARLSVGGDSAGGNLAAAAAIALRGEVPLIAQLLVYPACDFDMTRPSYLENPDGPLVKPGPAVGRMYTGGKEELLTSDPRVAPLLAESHAGLPPSYVAVAENDPLRDSGVAYAEALQAACVPLEFSAGPGLIHGYLRAMPFSDRARTSLRAMSDWLSGLEG